MQAQPQGAKENGRPDHAKSLPVPPARHPRTRPHPRVHPAIQHVPVCHQLPLGPALLPDTAVGPRARQDDDATRRPARTPTAALTLCALHTTPALKPLCTHPPLPKTYLADTVALTRSPCARRARDVVAMSAMSRPSLWRLYKPPPRLRQHHTISQPPSLPPSASLSPSSQHTRAKSSPRPPAASLNADPFSTTSASNSYPKL
nr:proline-rich receptor-like protein kinase PERK9 [Lolium perenne]